MRAYVKPARQGRFDEQKICDNPDCHMAGLMQPASSFCKVRGGGTVNVCNECKRRKVSESMKAKWERDRGYIEERQQAHFEKTVREQRIRRGLDPETGLPPETIEPKAS